MTSGAIRPTVLRWTGGVPADAAAWDVALAVLAAVVQIGGTALAARHQPHARTLDVYGYLLLAAGPVALIARRRQPVPVLVLAFATTLGYVLLGYPGGPIWLALIVAFGTALIDRPPDRGLRLAAGRLPGSSCGCRC